MSRRPPIPAAAPVRRLTRAHRLPCNPCEGERLALPYRGRYVPVVVMHAIAGYYRPGLDATDVLARTADGRYLLAREVSRDRLEPQTPRRLGFRLPQGRHWLRVRRVSLRAALLHVTRDSDHRLRQDLLAAMHAPPTNATPAGRVPVTLWLRPDQRAMLGAVAEYDERPSIEAAILRELEAHVVCSASILGLSEDEARERWRTAAGGGARR